MFSRYALRFGDFDLDPANHLLRRNAVVIKLAPQPFKVLLMLVESRGALVPRAALRQAIWGDETVVDFEHGLNTCIRHIRLALGDAADVPRFIETVPRLGYRFIAEVDGLPPAPGGDREWPAATRGARILPGLVGVVLLAGVVAGGSAFFRALPEAHDVYMRGHLALEDPTPGGARTAIDLFEEALAIDSTYAVAHAGLARAYLQKPSSLTGVSPAVALSRARAAAERALGLDQSLPEAHLAAAELQMTQRDWTAAGRHYESAIQLAPHRSITRQQYALWLSYQARFDEALKEARAGEQLEPLSVRARTTVAEVLRHARRFDAAIVQAQSALELNPNFGRAHSILGHSYLAQGRHDAAIEAHERSSHSSGNLGSAYALAGRTEEARRIVGALEERYESTRGGAGEIAQVYIGLLEFDRAFDWLARAVEEGSVWTLKVAVVWDPLRSDPRFQTLLQASGYGRDLRAEGTY